MAGLDLYLVNNNMARKNPCTVPRIRSSPTRLTEKLSCITNYPVNAFSFKYICYEFNLLMRVIQNKDRVDEWTDHPEDVKTCEFQGYVV